VQTQNDVRDISIVVPNYNHAHHLGARIRSFLDQTCAPKEIIIVDDASTDGSRKLIEELAAMHPEIIPLFKEKNAGVNEALADGLNLATCKYVVLASADDICLPAFLDRSFEALSMHPDAVLVFSDPAEHIDATGEERRFEHFLGRETFFMSPDQFAQLQRRRSFRIPTNTVMFKREPLIAVGGFRKELHWHADWFAIMQLCLSHGACYVPEVLCYVRVCEDSYSVTSLKQKDRHAEVVAKCLDYIYQSHDEKLIERFRLSALMPQHEFLLCLKLLSHQSFRHHISPALVGWAVIRQLWSLVRPCLNISLRNKVRGGINRMPVGWISRRE